MAEEKETFLRNAHPAETANHVNGPSTMRIADGSERAMIKVTSPTKPEDNTEVNVRQPTRGPKYADALKTLCPVRCGQTPDDTLPLENNGFYNYITFGWLTPYMWRVYKRGVTEIQGLHMRRKDKADVCVERMSKFWEEEVTQRGSEEASFGRVIFRAFKTRVLIGLFASVLSAVLVLANPVFVIRYFLEYLSTEEVNVRSGIVYAILLAVIILLQGITGGFFWMINFEAAARIKYGSLALLYKKVLRVKSFKDKTAGDLINFISNDSQRIWDAIIMGPFITATPIILILSCIYGVYLLGPWALVGWFTTIFFLPFMVTCAKMSMKYREISIKLTDRRVSWTTELITCMKLIKMYAWEECFSSKIIAIRSSEQRILEKGVFATSVAMGTSMLIPIFASILTFVAYVATGNNLTPTQAFTFVSLLNTMQGSLMAVPFALKSISEVKVTVDRFKEILMLDEMDDNRSPVSDSSLAVEVKDASCSWKMQQSACHKAEDTETTKEAKGKPKKDRTVITEEEERMAEDVEGFGQIYTAPVIKDVTFTLKKGDMLGVCGHVGCGKTSLITALLGRMDLSSGTVSVSGNVAYVSQLAWITNDTIKNNILFGEAYDELRYKNVIEACALSQDVLSLPAGDETEVGERGATLSGGQKQRISLARAAYSNCNVILLDDPLSSVDIHIGQHIFEHCIMGIMKKSTVVLVTHQLQYLKSCTRVMVMKEGLVVELGSHEELSALDGEYATLISMYNDKDKGHNSHSEGDNPRETDERNGLENSKNNGGLHHDDRDLSLNIEESTKKDRDPILTPTDKKESLSKQEFDGQLTEEEEIGTGSLSPPVLRQYIQAMGGFPVFLCVLLCFALPVAGVTTAGWYLTHWLEQGGGGTLMGNMTNKTERSMRVVDHPDKEKYLIVYSLFIPLLIIVMLLRSFSITKVILKAATYLHNTAFKKVLYRPMAFFDSTPLGRIVNRFSADQDEIDTRLPMNAEVFLNNILQVIAGLAMIAYVSPWFLIAVIPFGILFFFLMIMFHTCVTVMKRLDNVTRSPVMSHMGATVQGLTTIQAYQKSDQFMQKHCQLLDTNSVPVFLFYCANRWLALRMDVLSSAIAFLTGLLILLTYDHLSPALAGLAISYSVQMSGLFQFTARLFIETEARFTSVQRILKYCNLIKIEQPPYTNLADWPSQGSIKFDKVRLRYKDNLPLALNDVTISIASQEKIGVVGRTGAGKSSLAAAIFRLTELERGHVYIDNRDIATVNTRHLRSEISIIPQDPVLFSGTIRYNLDPLGEFADADIWQVLAKCHIREMVKSFEHELDTDVEETGGNFSLGERQLLCMARALLRDSQILILDEATAAIDTETDALIQKTLKDAFGGCTMLIIAHRLNTVLNCDKILVMKDGKVQEFDTPSKLLSDPHSQFKSMLEASEDH